MIITYNTDKKYMIKKILLSIMILLTHQIKIQSSDKFLYENFSDILIQCSDKATEIGTLIFMPIKVVESLITVLAPDNHYTQKTNAGLNHVLKVTPLISLISCVGKESIKYLMHRKKNQLTSEEYSPEKSLATWISYKEISKQFAIEYNILSRIKQAKIEFTLHFMEGGLAREEKIKNIENAFYIIQMLNLIRLIHNNKKEQKTIAGDEVLSKNLKEKPLYKLNSDSISTCYTENEIATAEKQTAMNRTAIAASYYSKNIKSENFLTARITEHILKTANGSNQWYRMKEKSTVYISPAIKEIKKMLKKIDSEASKEIKLKEIIQ